jgi:hypothetical protein
MHEQSETVGRNGKFYNVYGANTPKAGQVLPGEPAYNTLKEAVTAAENRSEQYGRKRNPEGNKMADKIEEPKGKALEDLRRQRAEREQMKKEAAAPTTKTEMGKLFKKGGSVKSSASIRGGGIESRGKTKGRFV